MAKTLKTVNTLDVTYADSFTHKDLKINEIRKNAKGEKVQKGVGEKRIYCGSIQKELDAFFLPDENGRIIPCYIYKEDLMDYYNKIKPEFDKSIYGKGDSAKKMYKAYEGKIRDLEKEEKDRLELHFSKTYDSQNRYYLVLDRKMQSKKNYSFIHEICLPRVTRLLFFRLKDENDKNEFIYLKPYIGSDLYRQSDKKKGRGSEQVKFRRAVYERCPSCVITKVEDSRLLEACHIMEYARSKDSEVRTDGENGIMMTPTFHKLFDLGYMSFDENGHLLFSPMMQQKDIDSLIVDKDLKLPDELLTQKTKNYMKWRNDNIFIKFCKPVQDNML